MTSDFSLSDYNLDSHHGGADGTPIFSLADGQSVTRETNLTNFHTQSNRFSAALRAKYEDAHKSISNRLTLSYSNQPHSDAEGEVSFSNAIVDTEKYSSTLNRRTLYPRWYGEYYFDLGRNISLSLVPNFHYYHVNSDSRYSSFDTDIKTIARENVFEGSLQAQLNKQFNDRHGLNFNLT